MEIKDPAVTKKHIDNILEALDYFDEVVLCVPDKLYKFYSMGPARGDDRLYIHGVEEVSEDN